MTTVFEGWAEGSFHHDGVERRTFRKGAGPCVIVIHEIPGVTPRVAAFAEEVVAAGFTVVMPSLLGEPGRALSNGAVASALWQLCVSREFTVWALGRTSPIVTWLRALAREAHAECGGPGVGAVGMCFSGGFALGMMVDAPVVAPVLCQPSLPAPTRARSRHLDLSPEDLAAVKAKVAAGCDVLGLRYAEDPLVGERFDTLRRELGDRFLAVELPSRRRSDHSVLTEHRD
ncbi:MAG: dienelactone hydrolase family protein, partial [Myxococcota bacterium]